jgi:hypothetical protein
METTAPRVFKNIPPYWVAVGITAIVSWLLTLWCVYADGQYGIALFILLPVFVGAAPVLIYNRLEAITWGRAKSIAFVSLGIYTLGLLVFAIEGLICLFMAAPFGTLLTWIGAGIGHAIAERKTGSFVEPITVWDKPNLLAFSVEQYPAPMRELSFWDVDAPHLHDYFVSQRGQFKLTRLPGNRMLLEGTTWYFHDIRPEWYWRWWSNAIVHAIHERVLIHIKTVSEKPISQ